MKSTEEVVPSKLNKEKNAESAEEIVPSKLAYVKLVDRSEISESGLSVENTKDQFKGGLSAEFTEDQFKGGLGLVQANNAKNEKDVPLPVSKTTLIQPITSHLDKKTSLNNNQVSKWKRVTMSKIGNSGELIGNLLQKKKESNIIRNGDEE